MTLCVIDRALNVDRLFSSYNNCHFCRHIIWHAVEKSLKFFTESVHCFVHVFRIWKYFRSTGSTLQAKILRGKKGRIRVSRFCCDERVEEKDMALKDQFSTQKRVKRSERGMLQRVMYWITAANNGMVRRGTSKHLTKMVFELLSCNTHFFPPC